MEFTALSAVTFIHEDEDLSHSWAGLFFQLLNEGFEVADVLAAKLVDKGAHKPGLGLAELAHQVSPTACPLNVFSRFLEDSLDLLVQRIAVGDYGDAGIGVVLQNPLCEQHHHDAFAAALCVPDDTTLAVADVLLRCFNAKVLMHPRHLLNAAIEQHKVVHQLYQSILAAELEQILIELETAVVFFVFLPLEEILLGRFDCAV